jgi:hypothetical protein
MLLKNILICADGIKKNGSADGVPVQTINQNSVWLPLENGIEIQFTGPDAETPAEQEPFIYQTGDYWLIPARTVTGDVKWPGTPADPDALLPQGMDHHYAPLALITDTGLTDLRRKFNRPDYNE